MSPEAMQAPTARGSIGTGMSENRNPIFGCKLGKKGEHILAWERVNGTLPDGMLLHRMCKWDTCSALHHIEAVTKSESEKLKHWKHVVKRTHCAKGHDLSTNAVVTPEGGRVCRQCNRDAVSA